MSTPHTIIPSSLTQLSHFPYSKSVDKNDDQSFHVVPYELNVRIDNSPVAKQTSNDQKKQKDRNKTFYVYKIKIIYHVFPELEFFKSYNFRTLPSLTRVGINWHNRLPMGITLTK